MGLQAPLKKGSLLLQSESFVSLLRLNYLWAEMVRFGSILQTCKSVLSAEHLMCEPHDGHGLISRPNTSFYYGIPSMARRGFLRTPHVLFVALDHLQQRPLV